MTRINLRRATVGVVLMAVIGCDALDVSDPTAIEKEDVMNAIGANLLRLDALARFHLSVPDHAHWTGMVADEIRAYWQANSFDRRDIVTELRLATVTLGFNPINTSPPGGLYERWQGVRSAATLALQADVGQRMVRAHRGELFALRGFAAVSLAESFCPGFPLHDVVDNVAVLGSPLSTEEVFERALADLDSALVYAADSARILNFARVGRARALLGLGRVGEAASTVTPVPTAYTSTAKFSTTLSLSNTLSSWAFYFGRSVADREGINGLDFVSAQDPRVSTVQFGNVVSGLFGVGHVPAKYLNGSACDVSCPEKRAEPTVVASGIEARLIESEAALETGDQNWLAILNMLRATQVSPALSALADPGSDAARVDLLFRERAFWLFLTGHRLGDLRRLINLYGRQAENVFPTGPYPLGGTYGPATSIAFPVELEAPHNPAVTGCTSN